MKGDINSNLDLIPGKSFKYIRGEIREFFIAQTTIYGIILVKKNEYNFQLNNMQLASQLHLGLDLIIVNGYCKQTKEGKIVLTDGKFGKAYVDINIKRYYTNNTITGKLIKLISSNIIRMSLFIFIEPFIVNYSFFLEPSKRALLIKLKSSEGDIIKVNVENKELVNVEILPRNHFLYDLYEVLSGNSRKINIFDFIILKQFKLIEKAYSNLESIVFQNREKVSKTELSELKNILYEKIYKNSTTFPSILLKEDEELTTYLEEIIEVSKMLLSKKDTRNDLNFILKYIKYFIPAFDNKRRYT